MKQYTTPDQTAKLIELGFVPGTRIKGVRTVHFKVEIDHRHNFTIGELIEILPKEINNDVLPGTLGVYVDYNKLWAVDYSCALGEQYTTHRIELVDALSDMIVKLKQEGVI